MGQPRILLCTVGTGNIEQLRETLFEPLKKSIGKGKWSKVILLPSQVTDQYATSLRDELPELTVEVRPLPLAGQEDNADACFKHFDQVIEDQVHSGTPADAMLVDFTRGTKAMSAALVLAAVRHDLPQLRYISGGQRDHRGMVVPGTEIVSEIHTTVATARKRLDDVHRLLVHGNFAAVLDLLPNPDSPFAAAWPEELRSVAVLLRPLAEYYAAWDRLDYRQAQQIELPAGVPPRWQRFLPDDEVQASVRNLAQPLPDEATARTVPLRWLAADLLANGQRRLRDHQFEDALIRGYRVLELIGQLRLCAQGIHSDDIPESHPVVQQFISKLAKKKQTPLGRLADGRLAASREQAARLLKAFGDPLAVQLLEPGVGKASRRNYSALIHGFEATSGGQSQPLRELYDRLESLLIADDPDGAPRRLRVARRLDFTVESSAS